MSQKDTIHFGYLHDDNISVGLLYYQTMFNYSEATAVEMSRESVEKLKLKDALYAAWLEKKFKTYGCVVYIAAALQKDFLDKIIKTYGLSKYLYYRQAQPSFNAGYVDEPRLTTYVFKEPI